MIQSLTAVSLHRQLTEIFFFVIPEKHLYSVYRINRFFSGKIGIVILALLMTGIT